MLEALFGLGLSGPAPGWHRLGYREPTESVWSAGVKQSVTAAPGPQEALSGAMPPGGLSRANLTQHRHSHLAVCPHRLITEPAINGRFTARPVKYCTLYLLPHIKHCLE